MGRKTIDVKVVVDQGNHILKHSPNDEVEYREGIIRMVEFILHESKRYEGFAFLSKEELGDVIPGIREWDEDKQQFSFENTDSTRRKYFIH